MMRMRIFNSQLSSDKSASFMLKIVFTIIISTFLSVLLISLLYMWKMSKVYNVQVTTIESANNVNKMVKEEIGQEAWYVVAGRVSIDNSNLFELLDSVDKEVESLYQNTSLEGSKEYVAAAIRASVVLRQYVEQLQRQVIDGQPVSMQQSTLSEINKIAENIYDILEEFTYAQINVIGEENSNMQSVSKNALYLFSILSVAVIVLAWWAYVLLKRVMNHSSIEIEALAQRILEGNLEPQIVYHDVAELNKLAEGINLMSGRIQTLVDDSLLKQKQLQKAEIQALQAQIAPHFLYNTFDTIVWLAEGGYNEKVVEVTIAFANYYRIALSSGNDFITVEQEVEHVRDYLIIQSIRYKDILQYEIEIDEEIKNCSMLKLLIQPIVENALYHGIKNKRGGGRITVCGRSIAKGRIQFAITDTGIGMTKEEVDKLQQSIEPNENPRTTGYGLYNVNRRLSLYYDDATLQVESQYGKGTTITFCLENKDA